MRQKRIAAVHDISGVGKCSLTVALPIISAAGIECCALPTAVLSTHTGGFKDFTFRDLTDDIMPVAKHWKKENIAFDAVYSGYLGSIQQVDLLIEAAKTVMDDNTLLIVDPVMADNGTLYQSFSADFPKKMKQLCKIADVITPNITEAMLMLEMPYEKPPYSKEKIEGIIKGLTKICSGIIVLTGVSFDEDKLGAAAYDPKTGNTVYSFSKKVNGMYHGTGDIFASTLTASIVRGKSTEKALETAVDFTFKCIENTEKNYDELWYGVAFEDKLDYLIKKIRE